MATVTYHFPGGLYPSQYNPPLSGVSVNPTFGELVDMSESSRSTTTSTDVLYRLDNGLKLKLVGTGFSFSPSGDAVGGTITSIEVLLNNGTTLVQTLSGLSLSLEYFQNAAAAFDNNEFEEWLLNRADTINGSAGHDVLSGHQGNDFLNGNGGDDLISGGEGGDTYDGGLDFDTLSFQDAYDTPSATRGISLNSTNGMVIDQFGLSETFQNFEEFRGTQFADRMVGSSADETFMGLGGRDRIDGRDGVDTVRYDRDFQQGATKGVSVNLTSGVAIDGFGSQDTLTAIENIRGTGFKDNITGNSDSNFLRGFAGADTLNGGAAADIMRGGLGDDTYYVENGGDIVDENSDSGAGLDTVRSSISFSIANTTAVKGNVENLVLLGTGAIDGTGNTLNNLLAGSSAANTLDGGAGDDLLSAGLGNDTLIGSTGLDTFFFSTALNASSNVDAIVDFVVVDDTIRLENGVFTAVVGTGVLTAAQFVSNTTGLAEDADDRIIYQSDTGNLFYDSDGNGAGGSVLFATLSANIAITAGDFVIT